MFYYLFTPDPILPADVPNTHTFLIKLKNETLTCTVLIKSF